MEKYLMVIDAGTGSVRAVIFDTQGNQIGVVAREWEHKEDPRWPGSMDFDWKYNWELTCFCIKEVLQKTKIDKKNIVAISTTSMREGILLYDADGNEIWACANVDARSTDEVKQLINDYPGLEKKLYLKSGETYALGALPRLLWVKNKMPDIYAKTAKIGMFNDWLIYKLTGNLAVEPSNASTTGLLDLKTRNWDPEIAKQCNLRTDIFPPIIECGTQLSTVHEQGATDTNLEVGIPVVVGGGDCQLGAIGVGAAKPGDAAVFGGSFWQYEYNTAKPKTDEHARVRVNCHAYNGVWQYEALAFQPGLVMRWYRDAFCEYEIEKAKETNSDPYILMDEKASKVPAGSYGMICCFSDIMNFINWKHASPTFTNFQLNPECFNRVTFYRAILENTALLVRGHIELVRESTNQEPDSLIFAGGASKSKLWAQILADVTGKKVKVPVIKEATALGAAILAGHGIGLYSSIEDGISKTVKWDTEFIPNQANKEIYEDLFQKWKKVYTAQLQLCDEKLTKNMWIAPGL